MSKRGPTAAAVVEKPAAGGKKTAAPPASPSLGAIPEPFREVAYFSKWSQTEPGRILLEEAPSDIAAILITTSCGSIVIVCRHGDVIGLENGDWDKVAWRSKIALPTEDDAIYHAAYDAGNDWIYLKISGECTICGVSRQLLVKSSDSNKGLPYSVIVNEKESDWRNFDGISVDSQRRILYACCYEDEREDITIWQITDQSDKTAAPNTALMASINFSTPSSPPTPRFSKEMKPYFCAFFIVKKPQKTAALITTAAYDRLAAKVPKQASNNGGNIRAIFSSDPDDLFVMVISDFWNHSVEMLVARAKSIDEAVGVNFGRDIGDLFGHAGTVACKNEEDSEKLGSIYAPYELAFDPAGNLFVADGSNKRVQIFTFSDSSPSAMTAVWASTPNDSGLRRLAVTVNPKTKKPATLALNGWRTILCYENT